jgi:hypothetical protein
MTQATPLASARMALETDSGGIDPLEVAALIDVRDGERWQQIASSAGVTLYALEGVDGFYRGLLECRDRPDGTRICERTCESGVLAVIVGPRTAQRRLPSC